MHILLTRPLEDCSEMILKFKSLGHQVSHLPLLSIDKINYDQIDFSNYEGIIFTSANAVKFLNLKQIDKKIFCFCVGNATEKKARDSGFQNVITAEGNVNNLKELVLQNFNQKHGGLIYVSGELVSTDLDQQLIKEGYKIDRVINYKTTHNQKFDEKFVTDLKLNIPDMVYIYSQNSAQSFLNFIKINQSENLWMNTNLMCIGEKTSSILNEIKWKKIFLFNSGEEEFLLYKI
ncbi:uroporphyrinogen-III synthase [Candidatus Pelagibacter bacterium nBUS_44]|jgi:uroporphyrinogen-III synthase|uniref:uroporphyrinogen-III synthase n=1 Tax=Candidatus Pelagibacter bacterium nBUS_44 TaxID=3374195 RepID=UPI003EBAABE9